MALIWDVLWFLVAVDVFGLGVCLGKKYFYRKGFEDGVCDGARGTFLHLRQSLKNHGVTMTCDGLSMEVDGKRMVAWKWTDDVDEFVKS